MKRFGLVILALAAAAAGLFYFRNLRGIGPAVRTPAPGIIHATNTTALPLTLPPGVSISIFARDLGAPRVLRQDPRGVLVTSVTKDGKVVALPDRDGNNVADEAVVVIAGLDRPHGLVFDDSHLYVAETHQIVRYDYDANEFVARNPKLVASLPGAGGHFTRTLGIGPDDRLYVSIGSSCNVCVERDQRRAAIYSMNKDGSDFKLHARGLRNSVFFTWSYVDGRMWATEMGRDLIGDDLPPDEINIVEQGKDYGWPYCYGKNVRDSSFGSKNITCDGREPSTLDLKAHSAPLGLAFVPEEGWPENYWHNLIVAFHGSWNRTEPTGYKLVRVSFDPLGVYGTEDFITGWLTPDGRALGRPADVLALPGGTLYVSDDKAGVIYRIVVRS